MTLSATGSPIEVHLGPQEWSQALRADARVGLTATPKVLAPTWLYDERGCDLFEQITRLPEYYPTRAERAVLGERASEIIAAARPTTLVELGSGTAEKTRLLLDALVARDGSPGYVPFDVAEPTLRRSANDITADYPQVEVRGVVGDFRRHLDSIPRRGRHMFAFLGGTFGNLDPSERAEFLASLASTMAPGDSLLLGIDLVKDRGRLVAAYDDSAGVTADFNRNVLRVLNRELGADFDPEGFEHVARFDEAHSRIEMHLRARAATAVRLPGLDLVIAFAAGETLRTEISTKFRRRPLVEELDRAGLAPGGWWPDRAGDYALTLGIR